MEESKNITKDMGKAVTVSFWSLGRLFKEGYVTGSNIDTDFHPGIRQRGQARAEFIRQRLGGD